MPKLPFRTPRALCGPRALAILVLVAGTGTTAVVSLPTILYLVESFGDHAWLVQASTALVGLAVLLLALRMRTRRGVELMGVFAGALGGPLNAVLTYVWMDEWRARELLGALLCGGLALIPLGATYGCSYAFLVRRRLELCTTPSHESFDAMLVYTGLWSATLTSVGGALVCFAWRIVPELHGVGVACAACIVVGLTAALVGSARIAGRRRFLARVRVGRAEPWRIVEHCASDDARYYWAPARSEAPPAVLVVPATATGDPYRSAVTEVAVALVPGDDELRLLSPVWFS